ncbi:augmin complex subunit dgt6 isoform X2 [Ceratitis capitata]|uniref:HAUS augmin-like complex subunit 6 N-terminal domain-containing protein n=1 Tax=Ceratitis capitata TaxID=7213 RepID=W8BT78_CERCA|nr:augmin complex subunit dgt6 isoform X2 [Ceratitis capitata]
MFKRGNVHQTQCSSILSYKRSEANFRTSTVEYLKYINEKHKLHWGDIKSYLVVMPGGKKFILFLLELVAFVVQEQIRHREKLLGAEVEAGHAAELNLKRMRKQNVFFKIYASAYINNVDEQIVQLRDKTRQLNNIFESLAKETGRYKTEIYTDTFIASFEKSNRELFEEKYAKGTVMVRKLEEPLVTLKEVIDKFQLKEAEMKYDKGRVRQALQKIFDVLPAENTANSDVFVHPTVNPMDDIHLNELIIAFNQIQPLLENAFIDVEQTRNCGELAAAELSALKNEFHRIESQITNLQLSLNSQMKKRTNNNKHTPGNMNEDCNSLMLKYVCTPPIKFETINAGRMDNIRLPLFADMQTKTASDPFCANISVLPRSARKVTVKDSSIDMNNTNNKSRIIDSTQLLRTIHKSAARAQRKNSQNLSTTSAALLSTSWRERQNLFHFDMESEPVVSTENTIKTISNVGDANKSINRTADNNQMNGLSHISTSPYTPFNSNERTRIPRTHLLDAINSSSGSGGSKTKVFYSRRLSAVQKVQGDSLNIANMSTSPSGRLDALVPTTNEYVDTPRLKLNDITMQENAIFIDKSDERVTTVQVLELSSRCVLVSKDEQKITLNGENDQNVGNTPKNQQMPIQIITDNDDDLFNISDTVLKDITM